MDPLDTLDSLVDNCAFGIYNTQAVTIIADLSNLANLSLFCAACKPGTTPTYDPTHKMIIACNEIDKCNFSHKQNNLYNQCRVCLSGY